MAPAKNFSLARKIQFTLIIVTTLLLVIWAIGEVSMRLKVKPVHPPYDSKEPDQLLGWKTKDNYQFKTDSFGDNHKGFYPVHASFTKHGFRKWNEGRNDSAKITIFFLGDSYTESIEASDDKVYYTVVADSLPARIFAAGTAGYGTVQELMVLERYIDSVRPNILVLEVCNNDFADNYYPVEERGSYKVGKRRPYMIDSTITYHTPRRSAIDRMKDHSLYLNSLLQQTNNILIQAKIRRSTKQDVIAIMNDTLYGGAQLYKKACDVTINALRKIKLLADQKGVKLYVFDADDYEPGKTFFPQICDSLGIDHVDGVAQDIVWHEQHGETLRAFDNYHWNNDGQKVVANKLIAYFRAHNINWK